MFSQNLSNGATFDTQFLEFSFVRLLLGYEENKTRRAQISIFGTCSLKSKSDFPNFHFGLRRDTVYACAENGKLLRPERHVGLHVKWLLIYCDSH